MKQKLKIMVDYRSADGSPTGVGNFTRELVAGLREKTFIQTLHVRSGASTLEKAFWHLNAFRQFWSSNSDWYISPESLIAPVLIGKRSALVVHDLTPFTQRDRHTSRNLVFHKLFFDLACRRTGLIFVPTEAVRKQLADRSPSTSNKTTVLPEASKFEVTDTGGESAPKRKNSFLYVGTIEPRKNVDVLVEAFLDARIEDWNLVVAGKLGWLSADQKAHLEALLASPNVYYRGYVSDAELFSMYESASVFVYVPQEEGFGLPPLEAMSCGLAVITSDDPALVEVSGGAARVVPLGASSRADLTQAMRDLAGNPSEVRRLQKLGRERAEHFSWRRTADVLIRTLSGTDLQVSEGS